MNTPSGENNLWGRDPISREIDSQVRRMPDRPKFILAIIAFNKSPEEVRFRHIGPFSHNFIRDFGYDCFNQKVLVALFGFESDEGEAFMGATGSLAYMNIDEAVLYVNGEASTRITKLKRAGPPPSK